MNELSNEMQNPDGDDTRQEVQRPPTGSHADQQGIPADAYQQGLPPEQGNYQQNTPPGSYQQYGYQPYPPGQQEYGYQKPFGAPHVGDVGPLDRTALGMKARTAGWLCYLFAWVTGLIFFLLERDSRFVRFHAMQSMLFFGVLRHPGMGVRSSAVLWRYWRCVRISYVHRLDCYDGESASR